MRLTTFLLFISASVWAQEPYLRIEKIDPDGKRTVRETPKKKSTKPTPLVTMTPRERELWEENQRLKAHIQKLDKQPLDTSSPYITEKQRYLALIVAKIQKNWTVDDAMRGHECSVNMQLSPTGDLESVTPLSGDQRLCDSAVNAIKKGSPFPMSSNPEVYDALRNLTPILKPELR
ncbi:cell envelope integrity protein TolA [Rheinheimera sp.]|uniref:cell envelope integrity protein TolA n=1 Tax=Rheinheimera sp. TaxID=1869214 RepID=UPI00307D995D